MQVPNENGIAKQTNRGGGNVFSSWNIDLLTDEGKIKSSGSVKKLFDDASVGSFTGIVSKFLKFDGQHWAVSARLYTTTVSAGESVIDSTWSADDTTNSPTSLSPNNGDAVVFDGKLIVVNGDDLDAYNGTAWDNSWWQTTLGAAALTTGSRTLLNVGWQGRLQVLNVNKLHTVDTGGTEYIAGAGGTLDYSETPYEFKCVVTTSNRTFVGTENTEGNEAIIIEWDEAPDATTANKQHKVGANAVRCLALWNDTPIAILSNGKIKYFNGVAFVDWEDAQFPNVQDGYNPDAEFIHPNGWAIIDELPHFLVKGEVDHYTETHADNITNPYYFPAGIYCLDPKRGLYHRWAVGSGTNTDEGHPSLAQVGALFSLNDIKSKWLANVIYYPDSATDFTTIIAEDQDLSYKHTSFFITDSVDMKEVPQKIEAFHKKLGSGDSLKFYYQQYDQSKIILDGTWASTTQFNTLTSYGDTEVGNLAFIKSGKGAGQLLKISALNTSTTVYQVVMEANSYVTAEDTGSIEILKFKYAGAINSTALDYKEMNLPSNVNSRKVKLLVIYEPAQGNKITLDNVII